jgi:hypothetical protein
VLGKAWKEMDWAQSCRYGINEPDTAEQLSSSRNFWQPPAWSGFSDATSCPVQTSRRAAQAFQADQAIKKHDEGLQNGQHTRDGSICTAQVL